MNEHLLISYMLQSKKLLEYKLVAIIQLVECVTAYVYLPTWCDSVIMHAATCNPCNNRSNSSASKTLTVLGFTISVLIDIITYSLFTLIYIMSKLQK